MKNSNPAKLVDKGMFFPYNVKLKNRARKMRNNPTDAEKKLWDILRQGELKQYKFLRQKIIGNYIADFYCSQYRLILEVDGSGHDEVEQIEYDKERTLFFENLGMKVLRFWNNDVLENPAGVYAKILEFFENKSPSIPLSKKREN